MRSVFYPHLVNGPFGDPALYVRLAHRGEALLFDCGDLHPLGTREMLKIDAVFLSHAHIDHLIGFDALLRAFLYRERPLTLYGPPGTAARIAGRLQGYTWNLTESYPFSLTVREWGETPAPSVTFRAREGFIPREGEPWDPEGGVLLSTPHYRVRCVPLDHGGITSLAFSLEEPLHVGIHKDALERLGYLAGPWLTPFKDLVRQSAPADTPVRVPLATGGERVLPLGPLAEEIAHTERGMKLCYVTDVAPLPENLERIVELAADAHLLAIEATFSDADMDRARQRNHLTSGLAGELARRARAMRLLVFHHSPRYQDRPELLREEAEAAFRGEENIGRPPGILEDPSPDRISRRGE